MLLLGIGYSALAVTEKGDEKSGAFSTGLDDQTGVKLYYKNPYSESEEIVTAILLSNNGGPIFKIGDEITFGYPGRIIFPGVPENLISKPTLVWLIENNLGIPLPKVTVRVYKHDTEKSLQFVGEDSIDHTPKDEKVRVKLCHQQFCADRYSLDT